MSRRDNEANQPYREEWLADSDDDGTDPVPMGIVVDRACRLYVRNIPQSEIDRDAHAAMRKDFEAYGAVDRYTLFVDKSGRYTGSAMVTYKEAGSAKNAMRGLNKRVNDDGSILAVEQARDDGAIPMSQLTERVRRDDEKQWSHDLFDEMQQPAPRGGRGGRRGRGMGGRGGGYGGRGGGGDNDDVVPPRQRGAQNSALTTEELDDMMAKYRAQKS